MGMTYSFAHSTVVLFVNTSSEEMMASSSSGTKTGTFFMTKVSRNHAKNRSNPLLLQITLLHFD